MYYTPGGRKEQEEYEKPGTVEQTVPGFSEKERQENEKEFYQDFDYAFIITPRFLFCKKIFKQNTAQCEKITT